MAIWDRLFGEHQRRGVVISKIGVDERFRNETELCISESRYSIFAEGNHGRKLVILECEPPLLAFITDRPSPIYEGEVDIMIESVYECIGESPRMVAEQLKSFV
jgi:hypothetical protein